MGYHYEGLYLMDDHWQHRRRAGFRVWRYRLIRFRDQEYPQQYQPDEVREGQQSVEVPDASSTAPQRRQTTALQIVRDAGVARRIKEFYDRRCRMCETPLKGPTGPYAEAAHVRLLGVLHNGPDSADNILCLARNTSTSSTTADARR